MPTPIKCLVPPKHSAAAVPPAAAKNARVASSRLHACCAAQRTPPAFGTVGTLHRISPAISPTCYSLHCCRSACGVSHASRYPGASRVITGSALPALVQLFVYNAAGSVFRLAYAYPACAGFVGRDSKAPHYQQKHIRLPVTLVPQGNGFVHWAMRFSPHRNYTA